MVRGSYRSSKVIECIRNGQLIYESNIDDLRSAQESVADAQQAIDEYNLQKQIDDAQDALDDYNDTMSDTIDALQEIADKWSEISSIQSDISNADLATSILGEGWLDKIVSGNDSEIYDTLSSLYQTNAKQLDEYQKQADSTANIQSLIEDFINSYKSGEITYSQALNGVNNLLSQMNQSMSAMDNLQNIYDYLGTVNGTDANAESILSGIKEGLSVTADELVKSLEQYNKNSGMISEYTSSWQQLTDNVASMLDVLKDVRDNLRDIEVDRDDDDDDNDNTRYGGGKDGSPGIPGRGEYVNSGPGVYANGIENGLVGSSTDSDREGMIKYLATNELKSGEIPVIAHSGEAILNERQQDMLLGNFGALADVRPTLPSYTGDLSELAANTSIQGDISISYGDLSFPNVRNIDDAIGEFAKMTDQALLQVVSKYK